MRPRTIRLILAIISILAGLSLAATTSATSPTSHEDELLRNATLVFEHAVEEPAAAIHIRGRVRMWRDALAAYFSEIS